MKNKKTNKQKLKDEADKYFSLYIRLKSCDWRGYVQCYTCDKIDHYKRMQCGHFVSRSSNLLRMDERNCRVQCPGCNVFKNGNYIEYTLRLIKEKGKKFVEKLREEGKQNHQFTEEELQEIVDKYKSKVKKLESKI